MYRTACFVVFALFQVIPRLTTATPIVVCDYRGECGPTVAPVCGSDNKTYANICSLLRSRCESNSALTVLYDGECTHNRGSRFVSEKCDFKCPHDEPVCGTDGQTYYRCTNERRTIQIRKVLKCPYWKCVSKPITKQ